MNENEIIQFRDLIISGTDLSYENAVLLTKTKEKDALYEAANAIRKHFCGDYFEMCTIKNAKSGKCKEDCKWCTQSGHYKTASDNYALIDEENAIESAFENYNHNVDKFSLVTSGKKIEGNELKTICNHFKAIGSKSSITLCASLGLLCYDDFIGLKESGVSHYHCNLETARSYFPNLCSTHSIDDKIQTIQNAQKAGLDVCSGGIIGMGETMEQRIELAMELRKLNILSIPVNILVPIKGTPLENTPPLTDEEILTTIAIFRFINPKAKIRFAGGRTQMEHIQEKALQCGINAALVGNYLTTVGSNIEQDKKMFRRNGFRINNDTF